MTLATHMVVETGVAASGVMLPEAAKRQVVALLQPSPRNKILGGTPFDFEAPTPKTATRMHHACTIS